ncbi:MAG: hypothetical protein JWR84_2471 [Caulobacter sp.]|nr:hypothetical protein [Caulobacter sp.]
MKRLIPLIAVLAVLAGPAAAGDVRCLMEHLPAEKRAEVEALYARSVDEGLASSLYSEADFEAMLAACKVATDDETRLTAAAQALAGYEAETGVALWLKTNRDIDDHTLQGVWSASRLADPTVAEAASGDEALAATLVFELAAKLGLEDQEDLGNLAAYVSARLLRQTSERKF